MEQCLRDIVTQFGWGIYYTRIIRAYGMAARIAELGPGDSFGIGLAAILSGVDEYYALMRAHACLQRNLDVLMNSWFFLPTRGYPRHRIPSIYPPIDRCHFPAEMLTGSLLGKSLSRTTQRNSKALEPDRNGGGIRISYIVRGRSRRRLPAPRSTWCFTGGAGAC
jgi:hypothetical protein